MGTSPDWLSTYSRPNRPRPTTRCTTLGVILTPHVAYYSQQSVENAKRQSVAEVLRVLSAQPPLHAVGHP
jgi:phosphoglycerate dehydrogenase-like enzyme